MAPAIFVDEEAQLPVGFRIHQSLQNVQTYDCRRIVQQIRENGGAMVKEEELATFVICAPTFEVALKYRYIMSGMKNSPKFRNPEWVERCLEFGYLVSDDKPIQGMPGRAKSNPYAYSYAYTVDEKRKLARYLAFQYPYIEDGGRSGYAPYQRLEMMAKTDAYFAWAKRSTWQGWRECYRAYQPFIDAEIKKLVESGEVDPDTKLRDHRRRGANRRGWNPSYGKGEKDEEEEEEEEEEELPHVKERPQELNNGEEDPLLEEQEVASLPRVNPHPPPYRGSTSRVLPMRSLTTAPNRTTVVTVGPRRKRLRRGEDPSHTRPSERQNADSDRSFPPSRAGRTPTRSNNKDNQLQNNQDTQRRPAPKCNPRIQQISQIRWQQERSQAHSQRTTQPIASGSNVLLEMLSSQTTTLAPTSVRPREKVSSKRKRRREDPVSDEDEDPIEAARRATPKRLSRRREDYESLPDDMDMVVDNHMDMDMDQDTFLQDLDLEAKGRSPPADELDIELLERGARFGSLPGDKDSILQDDIVLDEEGWQEVEDEEPEADVKMLGDDEDREERRERRPREQVGSAEEDEDEQVIDDEDEDEEIVNVQGEEEIVSGDEDVIYDEEEVINDEEDVINDEEEVINDEEEIIDDDDNDEIIHIQDDSEIINYQNTVSDQDEIINVQNDIFDDQDEIIQDDQDDNAHPVASLHRSPTPSPPESPQRAPQRYTRHTAPSPSLTPLPPPPRRSQAPSPRRTRSRSAAVQPAVKPQTRGRSTKPPPSKESRNESPLTSKEDSPRGLVTRSRSRSTSVQSVPARHACSRGKGKGKDKVSNQPRSKVHAEPHQDTLAHIDEEEEDIIIDWEDEIPNRVLSPIVHSPPPPPRRRTSLMESDDDGDDTHSLSPLRPPPPKSAQRRAMVESEDEEIDKILRRKSNLARQQPRASDEVFLPADDRKRRVYLHSAMNEPAAFATPTPMARAGPGLSSMRAAALRLGGVGLGPSKMARHSFPEQTARSPFLDLSQPHASQRRPRASIAVEHPFNTSQTSPFRNLPWPRSPRQSFPSPDHHHPDRTAHAIANVEAEVGDFPARGTQAREIVTQQLLAGEYVPPEGTRARVFKDGQKARDGKGKGRERESDGRGAQGVRSRRGR